MAHSSLANERKRSRLREGLLWLGFLLVLVAAIVTVAIPELAKEPQDGGPSHAPSTAAPKK
jgi:hypothetical protein